jgi:hypothetical protein
MVDVSTDGDTAVFEVIGLDKLWSLRSRLQVPLSHITRVEANHDQVSRWWHGIKILGTDVPGLFAAGTFYYHGERVFWDVRDLTKAIILSLEHERFRKLIIEVADPEATIAMLQRRSP